MIHVSTSRGRQVGLSFLSFFLLFSLLLVCVFLLFLLLALCVVLGLARSAGHSIHSIVGAEVGRARAHLRCVTCLSLALVGLVTTFRFALFLGVGWLLMSVVGVALPEHFGLETRAEANTESSEKIHVSGTNLPRLGWVVSSVPRSMRLAPNTSEASLSRLHARMARRR